MHLHQRKAQADVVVDELVEVELTFAAVDDQHVIVRTFVVHIDGAEADGQVGFDVHLQGQVFQTAVALDHDEASDPAGDLEQGLVALHADHHAAVRILDLTVLERLKERFPNFKPE